MLSEGFCLLLEYLGVFETEFGGGLLHRTLIFPDYVIHTTLQKPNDLRDIRLVFLSADGSDAATFAASDMEIQAGTEFLPEYGLARDLKLARAQRIVVAEEFQQIVGMGDRTVRSEIGSRLPVHPAGQEYPRELFVGNDYPGICLGVLQQDVVMRLVLLDEIVLQKQGVSLRIDHGELGVGDLRDQEPGLYIEPFRRDEILGHPLVEVLCLTHINHLPRGIVITIDPRGMWEQGYFLPDRKLLAGQNYLLALTYLATSASMSAPRRSLLRIVPSGPMSMM